MRNRHVTPPGRSRCIGPLVTVAILGRHKSVIGTCVSCRPGKFSSVSKCRFSFVSSHDIPRVHGDDRRRWRDQSFGTGDGISLWDSHCRSPTSVKGFGSLSSCFVPRRSSMVRVLARENRNRKQTLGRAFPERFRVLIWKETAKEGKVGLRLSG